jgi:hypothetical protein
MTSVQNNLIFAHLCEEGLESCMVQALFRFYLVRRPTSFITEVNVE